MLRLRLPKGGQSLATLGYYLQALILHIQDPSHPQPPPHDISLDLQIECYQIASVVAQALAKEFEATWDIEEYIRNARRRTALADESEEALLERLFPPVTPKGANGLPLLMDEACIVSDSKGQVLMYYLPSIISPSRQAKIIEAIEWLSTPPQSLALKVEEGGNFRTHPGKFQDFPGFPLICNGVATYASAWPQQGHQSSTIAPSANFRVPKEKAQEFIEKISESLSVIGAILSLIHPALFEAGLDVLAYLESGGIAADHLPTLKKLLSAWTSPFTAFSVINNRETEVHRDTCSPQFAYDMLYTGGFYSNGRIEVRGLGVRCRYDPGTVVCLPSAVFPHGVGPVNGPWVCIAQYMRQNVLEQNAAYRPPTLPTAELLNDLFATSCWTTSQYQPPKVS